MQMKKPSMRGLFLSYLVFFLTKDFFSFRVRIPFFVNFALTSEITRVFFTALAFSIPLAKAQLTFLPDLVAVTSLSVVADGFIVPSNLVRLAVPHLRFQSFPASFIAINAAGFMLILLP